MVDERHVGRFGDLLDRVASLLLGADEQDGPTAVGKLVGERLRLVEQRGRLDEVDDVVATTLAEDETAHLGVPAARLVAEVNAGLQQLRDAYLSHGVLPFLFIDEFRPVGADPKLRLVSQLRAGPRPRSPDG